LRRQLRNKPSAATIHLSVGQVAARTQAVPVPSE
jgi:hypothetical protein